MAKFSTGKVAPPGGALVDLVTVNRATGEEVIGVKATVALSKGKVPYKSWLIMNLDEDFPLLDLKEMEQRVMRILLKNLTMEGEGVVKVIKKHLATWAGIAPSNLSRTLKGLKEKKLVVGVPGGIMVSPKVLWRGDMSAYHRALVKFMEACE